MTKAIVIFRETADGETVAFFPCEPFNRSGADMVSYMHVGQHGAASVEFYHDCRKPRFADRVAALRAELIGIGYDLEERLRLQGWMHCSRYLNATGGSV